MIASNDFNRSLSRIFTNPVFKQIAQSGSNDYFLGKLKKAALETLVYKVGPVEEWLNEIVDHPQLDYIRNYVRRGDKPAYWEYYQRRVYNEGDQFLNKENIY